LARLDPDLAAVPLDSGLRPLLVVEAPLRARLAETAYFLDKATSKVRRKLTGAGRSTLGSTSVSQLWHRHRLFGRLPRESLLATGLFDPAVLDTVVSGQWLPDRPTLG